MYRGRERDVGKCVGIGIRIYREIEAVAIQLRIVFSKWNRCAKLTRRFNGNGRATMVSFRLHSSHTHHFLRVRSSHAPIAEIGYDRLLVHGRFRTHAHIECTTKSQTLVSSFRHSATMLIFSSISIYDFIAFRPTVILTNGSDSFECPRSFSCVFVETPFCLLFPSRLIRFGLRFVACNRRHVSADNFNTSHLLRFISGTFPVVSNGQKHVPRQR